MNLQQNPSRQPYTRRAANSIETNGHSITGIVKWFDPIKGFGFITCSAGDVFVHYRAIVGKGYRNLEKGQSVSFFTSQTDKGLQAENVTVDA